MDLGHHNSRYSTDPLAGRLRYVLDVTANGGVPSLLAWGNAAGCTGPQRLALKARFISRTHFKVQPEVKRAFSACVEGDFNSWGAAPGWRDTAPLALNRCLKRRLYSVLQK